MTRFYFALFCLVMALSSNSSLAKRLDKIVVFGDSLSDNGNFYRHMNYQVPASPPYYNGRFTNGLSWVELIQDNTNENTLLDYAFGGAGVSAVIDNTSFNLRSEVEHYLQDVRGNLDSNSLFIIWIGSNNYLSFPDNLKKEVLMVVAGIAQTMERLISLGATEILLVNVPDLGKTPIASDYDAVAMLTKASLLHNVKLYKLAKSLQLKYKNLHLMYYDVRKLMDNMMSNPQQYGFTNISGTCYEIYNARLQLGKKPYLSMMQVAANMSPAYVYNYEFCDSYMFFDPVHPSAQAHRAMAADIKRLLVASNIELN